MKPLEPTDPRVELRAFLAGVPYSHDRDLTPSERKDLTRAITPYMGLTALFLILSFLLLVLTDPIYMVMVGVIAAALLSVPAFCLYWTRPYRQALRSGKISLYIGRMSDVASFDVAQAHFRRHPEMDANRGRYIELLAIGARQQVWRLEGIDGGERLSGVRPMWLALVPDLDERGERPLTNEEKRELGIRMLDFLRVEQFLFSLGGAGFFACIAMIAALPARSPVLTGVIAALLLGVVGTILMPWFRRLKFSLHLLNDMKAGIVRDGSLASGLPWVVRGEPAQWRLGMSRGGREGVTREEAIRLEESVEAPQMRALDA